MRGRRRPTAYKILATGKEGADPRVARRGSLGAWVLNFGVGAAPQQRTRNDNFEARPQPYRQRGSETVGERDRSQ